MTNKPKWYSILLLGLVLLLAISAVGCGSTSERKAVEAYLSDTEAIINEATSVAVEVSNLYKTASQSDSSAIILKCANYGKQYDELLGKFISMECPEKCSKLQEYVINALSCCKQEVTEFGAYFATRDINHLYKAESYYTDAQKAIALAAGEWDRLNKLPK